MQTAESLLKTFDSQLSKAKNLLELERLEVSYLGRNGKINELLGTIKNLNLEERKSFGISLNSLKKKIYHKLVTTRESISKKSDHTGNIDVTLPGKSSRRGSIHLVTMAIEEITGIFEKLGFIRVSYPEVEWEYFSFESLNMPKGHPARDDFETSFISFPPHPKYGKMVLTPHTSSGQVREMWRVKQPPIRMVNISKCYRPNLDATHTPMFFQFEGLCVDKGINITHLKGSLDYFAKEYFGPERKTRLRPHHFQFTEPSFEVDVTCDVCSGSGIIGKTKCKVCKSGWLELGGTGMVHPNVLKAGNIDSNIYTGWAFGFGVERVVMMKYGIDDIRYYYSGDIRFLEQF